MYLKVLTNTHSIKQQQQPPSPAPATNDVAPVVPASVKSSPCHYFIRHSTHTISTPTRKCSTWCWQTVLLEQTSYINPPLSHSIAFAFTFTFIFTLSIHTQNHGIHPHIHMCLACICVFSCTQLQLLSGHITMPSAPCIPRLSVFTCMHSHKHIRCSRVSSRTLNTASHIQHVMLMDLCVRHITLTLV